MEYFKKSAVLIIFFTTLGLTNSNFIYTAITPKIIRPHSIFEVIISVEESTDGPIEVEVSICPESLPNKTISKKSVQVPPQTSLCLNLTLGALPDERYNMTIIASSEGSSSPEDIMSMDAPRGLNFRGPRRYRPPGRRSGGNTSPQSNSTYHEESAILIVDNKEVSILIQTDKPVYKPGEVVKFRVMFLNRNLRPVQLIPDSVTIEIFDAQRNVIKSWKKIEPPPETKTYGLIKKSLELSKEPNLGDWSIEVSVGKDEKAYHSFAVDQYILPKFKVEVKAKPSFVTYNNSKFTVEVSSTYTHGKGVKGQCTLVLKPMDYYYGGWSEEAEIYDNGIKKERRVKQISKTYEIDGKSVFEFDLKTELKVRGEDATDYGSEYIVEASCTDQVSAQVRNASLNIKMYQHPYKISVAEEPNHYKPGFPLTMTIKVASQDDVPISDSRGDALKIEHGFSYDTEGGTMHKAIPPTGLVTVTFTTPTNEYIHINGMDVTYKDLKQYISIPMKQTSPTKTYMQLSPVSSLKKHQLVVEEIAYISVKINKPVKVLNYLLIARGTVIKSERVPFPTEGMEQMLSINLPSNAAPEVRLIVFTLVAPTNEVIVDTLTLQVKSVVDRHLQISLKGGNTVEPGANITIECDGLPNSLVALRGVDQSVLLLKEDKDVTDSSLKGLQETFDQNINSYRSWGGSQAFQTFEEAGLHIFTNGQLKKSDNFPIAYEYKSRPMAMMSSMKVMKVSNSAGVGRLASGSADMAMAAPLMMEDSGVGSGAGGGSGMEVRVRKSFPETWIFMEVESLEGKIKVENTVPDTITSWMLNGFQINPQEGMGIAASPTKLTVFRPFFISLSLPYSVVRGEVLSLQVMVHNYMTDPVTAKVTLDNSEGLLDVFGSKKEIIKVKESTKEVKVNASSVTTVSFLISPKKVGTTTLNLKAVTPIAGDGLSQPLIVKPPGVKQTKNYVVFLNLLAQPSVDKNLSAVFPDQRVPDGDILKISVLGDILGGTINNLDKLIELPRGCGEQNLLNFVPDIVILDYLNATDALTDKIHQKAIKFLQTGYQQELTYRRSDGSFSAFGASDKVGSTWLTAFVAKSFISAKRYIDIDDNVVTSALEFLVLQQSEKGSFFEEGYVYDKGLQGGVSRSLYALTAYTLLTFVEASKQLPKGSFNYTGIINSGVKWLIMETSKEEKLSCYAANLITYLFHVINHPKKDEYFKKMEEHSKTDSMGELKYWEAKAEYQYPDVYSPWESRVKPASVEMTSYALLTYLIREGGQVNESIAIAKWLMKQRNAAGGFLSTQDTVLGVTALAKFAQVTRTPDYNMKVKASWKGDLGQVQNFTFKIGKEEMTTLQEYYLPLAVREVKVNAEGVGTALAQLTWTYYTENKLNDSGFYLDVQMQAKDKNRRLELKICAAYLEPGKSTMPLLEVNTPTGYTFDAEELIELKENDQIMRHELEDRDTKLHIYFSSLSQKKESCVQLKAYRVYLIAKHSQAQVVLYDYYDTTRSARKSYAPPKTDICQICAADSTCEIKNCV